MSAVTGPTAGLRARISSSPSPAADPLWCCLSAVQFALQLEYLEAAFYSCATTGAPLPANVTGSTTVITEGCMKGNYTEETIDVFGEIAADELNHVKVSSSSETVSPVLISSIMIMVR